MTRLFSFLAVLGWGILIAQATPWKAEQPPAKDPMLLKRPLKLPTGKELMAMKLKQGQTILEGLTMNDFGKIRTVADDLQQICDANEFLNAYKGPEYKFHMQMFRRSVEAVAKKADDKNLDGVIVAYNDLTLSCLKCHQGIRDKMFEVMARPNSEQ
jgi:hypothetical protein